MRSSILANKPIHGDMASKHPRIVGYSRSEEGLGEVSSPPQYLSLGSVFVSSRAVSWILNSSLFVTLSQDAGSQQIGFLLGSCGVTVALTSDACHKGLPKSPTGEIPQFKGMIKQASLQSWLPSPEPSKLEGWPFTYVEGAPQYIRSKARGLWTC